MADPTYELLITDLTEIEIRGTDDIPVYVTRPYFEQVRVRHPTYTASNHFGKRRSSHTFHSDDVAAALQTIRNGGEEKEIAKAVATNVIWAEQLYKYCVKLQKKLDKAAKSTKKPQVIVKPKMQVVKPVTIKPKVTKPIINKTKVDPVFKVDTNQDIKITLNNWI